MCICNPPKAGTGETGLVQDPCKHIHFFSSDVGSWLENGPVKDALRDVQTYKNIVPHCGNLISHSSRSFNNVKKYFRTVKSRELDEEGRQNGMVLLRAQLFKCLSHLLLCLLCVTCTL